MAFAGQRGDHAALPVAHGEGKFVARDAGVLDAIRDAHQAVFRYVAADGSLPVYPENPNGSEDRIAGLCDPSGQVLGLMPHPERHVISLQHPEWTRGANKNKIPVGLQFFKAAVQN